MERRSTHPRTASPSRAQRRQRFSGPRIRAEQRRLGSVAAVRRDCAGILRFLRPLDLRDIELLLRLRPDWKDDTDPCNLHCTVFLPLSRCRLRGHRSGLPVSRRPVRRPAIDRLQVRDVHPGILALLQQLRDRGFELIVVLVARWLMISRSLSPTTIASALSSSVPALSPGLYSSPVLMPNV